MSVNGNTVAPREVDEVVNVLREQVIALCADAPRLPSAVRVRAGEVTIEVEWPLAPATVPVAAPPVETPVEALPMPRPEPAGSASPAGTVPVNAATVGTFYRAPEPGGKPFVTEGDLVRPGQQIAIIEAMKLMIPVEADRAGRVVEICVADGTSVEHGQALLLLEPAP
ncbi:acetyl-CoA carboxylase biotin carboxyl carrier protein [Amycolatopsis pithecellobii]|uniref:Biotin carboxyl carrier protein of acetyl-CoA carboxylase n=1 Tax=Amycolatopsis pithecellobii TaxID=664692 RepID=A0A6N7Z8V5_9PSEU|nr:biotin/lipoyl-containing protein [Amycolatopsis pithecellobii]MTD58220.1 acetyl-CoA carboxylase biotin carboxyl carrier protein subunit [Amycolatopsis pithecellobii]